MKKMLASVGLVALGASSLQTASGQSFAAPDTSKPWSISATLRGFYDDNTATLPKGVTLPPGVHRSSFGFEVSPSAALAWTREQTTINLGVLYSLKYYEHKPAFSSDHYDQSFTFNGALKHTFNEQVNIRAEDSFVIGQEPDMLRAGSTFSTFQRVSGDNIRNYGTLALSAQVSPTVGIGFGYDNAFYDYKAKGASIGPSGYPGISGVLPSIAGTLNRDENRVHVEGLIQIQPETKGIIGYQFTEINYLSDEYVGGFLINPAGPITASNLVDPVKASTRDFRQHTVYVGVEHNFLPELTAAIRVGASYGDYYNDSNTSASYTPYVNATLKYSYQPECYVEGGFSYDRNSTDIVGLLGNGRFTTDAESAVVYVTAKHRLSPGLFGNLTAQFQNSSYHGGAFDNKSEQFYLAGLELEYRFNPFLAAHVGYDYDRLESSLGLRHFDRNRVYVGLTATY